VLDILRLIFVLNTPKIVSVSKAIISSHNDTNYLRIQMERELQAGRSRVRSPMVSLKFFIGIILPVPLWSWGQLSFTHKWVPGIFHGGKGGRCVGLTLPSSCVDRHEIWEPQLPGTLRACPGLYRDCLTFIRMESIYSSTNYQVTIKRIFIHE
jgi:hypothetical protein